MSTHESELSARFPVAAYYVSQRARDDGVHLVHRYGCGSIPAPIRRLYLGDFDAGDEAVTEARRHYAQVQGCELCAPPSARSIGVSRTVPARTDDR